MLQYLTFVLPNDSLPCLSIYPLTCSPTQRQRYSAAVLPSLRHLALSVILFTACTGLISFIPIVTVRQYNVAPHFRSLLIVLLDVPSLLPARNIRVARMCYNDDPTPTDVSYLEVNKFPLFAALPTAVSVGRSLVRIAGTCRYAAAMQHSSWAVRSVFCSIQCTALPADPHLGCCPVR